MTGYRADEPMGAAALVGFSCAQTGGPGWALIAGGAALESLRATGGTLFARAVWEGCLPGRRPRWLLAENYERMLHEPLDTARAQLGITEPTACRRAQATLGEALASYVTTAKVAPA